MKRILVVILLLFTMVHAAEDYYLPDLIKKADQNNPSIKKVESELREYIAAKGVAWWDWVPGITVGGYLDVEEGLIHDRDYIGYTIGFSRIFSQPAKYKRAEEKAESARHNLEITRRSIHHEVAIAYEEYVLHKKSLEIAKRAHAAAVDKWAMVKKFFASGNLTPDRVLFAQEIVSRFELTIEKEEAALREIKSRISQLVGEEY